jgi:hypothetical protein
MMINFKQAFLTGAALVFLTGISFGAGNILLAGFHEFNAGFTGKTGADQGLFTGGGTRITASDTSNNGGSTDGFYGPDTLGIATNQGPFNTSGYLFETSSLSDPRLLPGYAAGAPNPSAPGTFMNGQVLDLGGADLFVQNTSTTTYNLDALYFDSFLGDNSVNTTLNMGSFIVSISGGARPSFSFPRNVTSGFAGYHSQSSVPLDGALTPVSGQYLIDNQIDYGFGTNYSDYVLDLTGVELRPNETIQVRFNILGLDAAARGDNFALVAVPEPSSALLAFGGLLATGFLRRRR